MRSWVYWSLSRKRLVLFIDCLTTFYRKNPQQWGLFLYLTSTTVEINNSAEGEDLHLASIREVLFVALFSSLSMLHTSSNWCCSSHQSLLKTLHSVYLFHHLRISPPKKRRKIWLSETVSLDESPDVSLGSAEKFSHIIIRILSRLDRSWDLILHSSKRAIDCYTRFSFFLFSSENSLSES